MTDINSCDPDPIVQFRIWYKEAESSKFFKGLLSRIYPPAVVHQPDSMVLATATQDGRPSARVVLYKGISNGGFVFYTNYTSRKAAELEENPFASLVFHWGFPERQIRVEGEVQKITHEESAQYWQSRPRGSQIAGAVSPQSSVIPDRKFLEKKVVEFEDEYIGKSIPCPAFWGGYRLMPSQVEFWEGRLFRLHERVRYRKSDMGWFKELLAP